MKRKKVLLMRVLFLLVLFGLTSLTTSNTYAYWASSVASSQQNANALVSVGTWTLTNEWQSGVAYNTDDIVTFNGITYRSLRNNNTKTPGANGSAQWWQAI